MASQPQLPAMPASSSFKTMGGSSRRGSVIDSSHVMSATFNRRASMDTGRRGSVVTAPPVDNDGLLVIRRGHTATNMLSKRAVIDERALAARATRYLSQIDKVEHQAKLLNNVEEKKHQTQLQQHQKRQEEALRRAPNRKRAQLAAARQSANMHMQSNRRSSVSSMTGDDEHRQRRSSIHAMPEAVEVDAVPLTPDLIVSRAKCSVGELDIYMASLAISFADAEKAERMQEARRKNAETLQMRDAEYRMMKSSFANAQKHRKAVETSMQRELNQRELLEQHAALVAAESTNTGMMSSRSTNQKTASKNQTADSKFALTEFLSNGAVSISGTNKAPIDKEAEKAMLQKLLDDLAT